MKHVVTQEDSLSLAMVQVQALRLVGEANPPHRDG